MRKVFVFCCVALLTARVLVAFEANEVSISTSKRLLKWDTARGPISITLNSKGSADIPIAATEEAVKGALNAWQAVPNQSVRFQYAGKDASASANDSDMRNSIVWVESGWPYSPTVAAYTRYSYFVTDPPTIVDADIQMNGQNFQWSTNPAVKGINPKQVLLHELGHLLGLTHTGVINAQMYPFLPATVTFVLSPDDKTGLQFLYGVAAQDFRQITPVANSTYVDGLAARGLPLPVFRWSGPPSNYSVEVSDTPAFTKKVSFPAGSAQQYSMKAADEQKVLALSPAKNVLWRVSNGSARTTSRPIHFRPPISGSPGSAAVVWPYDTMDEQTRREILVILAVSISALIAAIAVFWAFKKRRVAGAAQ